MDTVTHHGRQTAYRTTNLDEGPRICYIHGAGGSHQIWVNQYGNRDGPPAVALDLSSHGDSDTIETKPGHPTLEAYSHDVTAVCQTTESTVLCGNSMGGAITLWTALERNLTLDALILCGSGAKLGVDDGILDALARNYESAIASLQTPNTLFHNPEPDLLDVTKRTFLQTGQTTTLRDFQTCDTFDIRDRLEEITLPTLAICGEHDPLTQPRFHTYLADNLPDCTYVEIPDAAHLPMLEQPAAVNDAIRSFLLSE